MIEVKSISEGLRKEGLGYGTPMTFLTLGPGEDYAKVETLVGQIVRNTRCKWICINGEETTRVGIGTLVSGLVKCDLKVELDYSDREKDPSWLLNADRWVVNYHADSKFNYMGMRSSDMVRFRVEGAGPDFSETLESIKKGFEVLKNYTGTKYILVDPFLRPNKLLMRDLLEIVVGMERCRIY